MSEHPPPSRAAPSVRWPFRIGAGLLGVVVLVLLWPLLMRAARTGEAKRLLLLCLAVVVLAGSYFWIALGGVDVMDRWIAARVAAKAARTAKERSQSGEV